MRVISQNEQFDFPYGQIVVTCDSNRVTCKPAHEMSGRYYLLGEYSTEEKAQKAMEMLKEKYLEPAYQNYIGNDEKAFYNTKVFQFPQDSEVEK